MLNGEVDDFKGLRKKFYTRFHLGKRAKTLRKTIILTSKKKQYTIMDALQERVIDLTIELVYLKVENKLLREEIEGLKKTNIITTNTKE